MKKIILALFLLICGCAQVDTDGCYMGMSIPADYEIFSLESPWNTAIDGDVSLRSGLMIQNLVEVLDELNNPGLRINYDKWTSPVHIIDSDKCPSVEVRSSNGVFYETLDHDKNGVVSVPIPDEAWSDPSEDGHMILVDLNKKMSLEFSRARKTDEGWEASNVDLWDLDSDGYREAFSGKPWWKNGARASGTPVIAGLVRVEEIEAGVINHALAIGLPVVRKSSSNAERELCYPAARTDGYGVGEEYIPMGARLQLNPELDLDGLSVEAKIIARALQQYGGIVAISSRSFSLYFQNTPEWEKYPMLRDIAKIPVEEFRVLECDLFRQ